MKISYLKFGQEIVFDTKETAIEEATNHLVFLQSEVSAVIISLNERRHELDGVQIKTLEDKRDALLHVIADIKTEYPDLNCCFEEISPYHFLMAASLILPKLQMTILTTEAARLSKIAEKQEQEDLLQQFKQFIYE